MRKKKGKKIVSILAATIMTVSVIFGALASGSTPAYAAEFSADKSSVTDWVNYLSDKDGNISTENVGRIWTDKTVATDQISFDGGNDGTLKIEKKDGSDFLVALSAMSSTSNIMTKTSKPLDIVLVLDMSGSMDETETVYEYTPVYDLNQNSTYYLDDGTRVTWSDGFLFWDPGWYAGMDRVEPKTSAGDTNASYVQFNTRRTTGQLNKINALKDAVNSFVDSTKALNDGITDESKKHQIGLVKFAGNNNTTVGNGKYNNGTYNYSQIVNHLTSDMTTLINNIKNLSPGGATQADFGMAHANTVLANSRKNAQKVVIFFTDGQPNDGNGFVDSVANSAIGSAKSLKNNGTLVYSVGIFADADPNITNDSFTGFMHGVSSNYPEATSYTRLGDRAADSNFYKAAKNADDLNNIFTEIAEEIQESAQGAPIQIQDGFDAEHSGYITFHDELGKYMKCDGFTDIVFAGKHFENVSSSTVEKDDNTVTTYTFEGTGDNNLYPDGNLSDIIITVTSYDDISKGDLVEVKIPAALIPVRNFHVSDGLMTVEETHPIRILYNASVKDGVIEDIEKDGKVTPALIKNPDEKFREYLKDNKTKDGKVKFFSNMWSGGDNGDTTATFEPADTNAFYKFTEDAQLFRATENDGKEAVTSLRDLHISTTDEYFFEKTYYTAKQSGSIAEKHDVRSYIRVATLDGIEEWMYEREGKVYIKQGTERTLRINDFTNTKKETNSTGTANYRINPNWDSTMTNIVVSLGNNGVATAEAGGALSISKAATIAEGMTGPVDQNGKSTLDNQEFTFEVKAATDDGEYTSTVFTKNADGSETAGDASTVKFTEGKATVKLKNKERIEIYGIKDGIDFTVKETEQPAGFKQVTPANNESVTGTINAQMSTADFINEYNATPVADVKSAYLGVTGTKTLDGRTFRADDVFRFVIKPSADNPGDAAQHQDYILTLDGKNVVGKTKADIDFGTVTFDKPGTYQYRINEYLPGGGQDEEIIPSITYDATNYRLTVNVVDNGEGKLEIANFKLDKRDDPQTETWTTVLDRPNGDAADKGYIDFTNTYNVDEQAISLRGLKQLSNKALADYGDVQFGFKITPAGYKDIGSTGEYITDNNQPMPKNAVANDAGAYIYKNGSAGLITMPGITFDKDDIGKEYKYVISELQPTKNGNLDGEPWNENAVKVGDEWTYKGITFDNTSTIITIKVESVQLEDEGVTKEAIKTTLVSSEPVEFEDGTYEFVFNNTYNAALDGEVTLNGTKSITGRSFTNGDSFTFNVEAQDGAPMPVNSEVTINPTSGKSKNFSFGKIDFTTANMTGAVKQGDGTYKKDFTYRITEAKGDKAGLTYDSVPVMATVTVTDDGYGKLTAEVKYTKNNNGVTNAEFTNSYKSSLLFDDVGGLNVTKTLIGRDMRASDAFKFTIKGVDTPDGTEAADAEAKLSAADKTFKTNVAAKSGEEVVMNKLGNMRFTHEDAGKTYSYEIAETKGSLGGVTYDTSKYTVAIEVIDNLDGTMHTVTTVTKGDQKNYMTAQKVKNL